MYFLTTTAETATRSSSFTMILLMVGMFAIMYFVMIRPQKKRDPAPVILTVQLDRL